MKNLIIYSKTSGSQLAALALLLNYNADSDLIEVSAIDDSGGATGIGDLIDAKTDGTYDYAFILPVCCDTGTAATAGRLSHDSYAKLRAKMKTASQGTLITSGTCVATGATTSKVNLAATETTTDDYFNNMIIEIGGTTGNGEKSRILNYVGSTQLAEIGGAAKTQTDATSTYKIYDMTGYIFECNYDYSGAGLTVTGNNSQTAELTLGSIGNATSTTTPKGTVLKAWEAVYPNVTRPLFVNVMGCYKFAQHAGVLASITDTTHYVLDATPDASSAATTAEIATDDFFTGKYLCITLGTGIGGFVKIVGYVGSTRTIELEEALVTAATNSSNYRIVDRLEYVFADVAAEYMSKLMFKHVDTDATAQQAIAKLIDKDETLQQNNIAKSDWQYLFNDFVAKGKAYFEITNVANL